MSRTSFEAENCSIARSLDALGDGWSLMIIRNAFFGTRRFADFERGLGISKNVLADRLRKLVEHEILERIDVGEHGERFEYRLTPRGRDLLTVVTALREWGDRWIFGPGQEPILIEERETGAPVPPLAIRNEAGRVLSGRDLRTVPGPGADERTQRRFTPRPRRD